MIFVFLKYLEHFGDKVIKLALDKTRMGKKFADEFPEALDALTASSADIGPFIVNSSQDQEASAKIKAVDDNYTSCLKQIKELDLRIEKKKEIAAQHLKLASQATADMLELQQVSLYLQVFEFNNLLFLNLKFAIEKSCIRRIC